MLDHSEKMKKKNGEDLLVDAFELHGSWKVSSDNGGIRDEDL